MKVAQLFESFPNPKNSPLRQKKEVKMSQKSSQNQKLKLKKRLKKYLYIIICSPGQTMVTIFTLYLLVGTQILSCLDFLLTTYVRET